MKSLPFYRTPYKEAIKKLNTNAKKGLNEDEVLRKREKYGLNEIKNGESKFIIFKLIWNQLNSLIVLVLMIAATVTFFLNHKLDTYVILGVLIFNTIIGFIQEYKANKAIEALKNIVKTMSKVYRNNEIIEIPAEKIVPGDIVILETGDAIPADGRLIEATNLQTIESSLTGEAFPIDKSTDPIPNEVALGDRTNYVWKGTFVTGGVGKVVITETGLNTAIGKIAKNLNKIDEKKSHFQEKTDKLTKIMSIIALTGGLLVFITSYFIRNMTFIETFTFAIAALVSGIPEGLPAILAVVLAAGAYRMAKKNAIIRTLPATETLSVVDTIGTDKTGTLTQNTMTVEEIHLTNYNLKVEGNGWIPKGRFIKDGKTIDPLQNDGLKKLLLGGGLIAQKARLINQETTDSPNYKVSGSPTDGGMLVLAYKAGLKNQIKSTKIIKEIPFNSDNKYKAIVTKNNAEQILSVSGAPEVLISLSNKQFKNGKIVEFTDEEKKKILKKVEDSSAKAMRTIARCYKPINIKKEKISDDIVNNLIFIGFVGMIDPPRIGAAEAVKKAREAGIRVMMMTGDHKNTALAIAKKVNILNNTAKRDLPLVMTGSELKKLSNQEFNQIIKKINVFARLDPDMKLKILTKLQAQEHTVAMTGDGVNDVLALKKADIGIAMGNIGTDVAKEAADIVLTDDNFASLVDAIEEARVVFMNTRNASAFLVHTNIDEDLEILFSILVGWPLPLLAIQILYMNLVTDGIVDIALAAEPSHGDVLDQPPRKAGEHILSKEVFKMMLPTIIMMAVNSLTLFWVFLPQGIEKARTIAFLTMIWDQLFNIFNWRSMHKSIFEIGLFSNKFIIGSLVISILLQILVFTNPYLMNIFSIVPLQLEEILLILGASSLVFITGELHKYFLKKKNKI